MNRRPFNIANRHAPRVQKMIDDLPDSHKQKAQDALDDLARGHFDPNNPPQTVDSTRYRIYAAGGDIEIIYSNPMGTDRIDIEVIRKRITINGILNSIREALVFRP
jgi:hypothetical protein